MTDHPVKHLFDFYSIVTLFATIAGWLPHIASALTVLWMAIRISETRRAEQFIAWLKSRRK
jgi:hypothetical protein